MPDVNHSQKITILYEDNHILAVEKPVNVPSQEDESKDADMLTLLKEDIKIRYNKPGNVFLGLVHRLDRPVGGVMVFARTSKAASRLSEQIRKREFRKTYRAVVHGEIQKQKGTLQHFLLKDNASNTVSVVSSSKEGAKEAILEYSVLDKRNGYSLVEIQLHTGRPHQIRVQLSVIGHPLFGDQKYGCKVNRPGMQIALWSSKIQCKHPTREEVMEFTCDLPEQEPWNWFFE